MTEPSEIDLSLDDLKEFLTESLNNVNKRLDKLEENKKSKPAEVKVISNFIIYIFKSQQAFFLLNSYRFGIVSKWLSHIVSLHHQLMGCLIY